MPRPLALTVVAALTAGTLITGCDTVPSEPTVTKQEAVARVEARAQEAFGRLPAGATLKTRSSKPDLPCDEGPDGRTFVENSYTIDYPQGWPIEQSLAVLADYWTNSNYTIVRDDRQDTRAPELVVEHPDDAFHLGYLLSYRDNGRIDGILRSSSTCVQGG
jgi:hypothetical protein